MKNSNISDALVLFGVSGDLSEKKIFPALLTMVKRGRLNCPVIGVARRDWGQEDFKNKVRESIIKHGKYDQEAFEKLSSLLHYVSGDYHELSTFQKLKQVLKDSKHPLYYLAIPPSLFTTVTGFLAKTDCSKGSRIVLEKPFGRDLKSSEDLNQTLHKYFSEEELFRIDHYLGKEPIQNLVYFRFSNPHIEAIWNNGYIENVQITMAETFGVEGRGKFYEEAGAVRDVIQNHMLRVITCLAMELPDIHSGTSVRDSREQLLKSIRTVDPKDIVRGQYIGYREEKDVAPDSNIETFAAIRFDIDSERWSGVPFYVRAGKKLPVTITEVKVTMKKGEETVSDYFRFRISPDVVIALGTNVKQPGEELLGRQIELVACNESPLALEAYDRLLGDALQGDETLFTNEVGVNDSWRIVDRILLYSAPIKYEPGTWGPAFQNFQWSDPSSDSICDKPTPAPHKGNKMKATEKLYDLGQSLWLDDLSRGLLNDGRLRQYIKDFSLTGLTSNPTIFEHAIEKSKDYDDDIAHGVSKNKSSEEIFFDLALEDLRIAADEFYSIHKRTSGVDGWVSLEVSPLLANDAKKTVEAAEKLHRLGGRSNIFIKIPGTPEGVKAIEESIYRGIPINVTLLFSAEQYQASAEAYLKGIERRVAEGLSPDVPSVASLFVSRWDVAVKDKVPENLQNKLGIAVAKSTYKAYLEFLNSPRVKRLMNLGMRPQRLLWASTGTKDPKASDTLYIEALAAPLTINTIPEKTLKAVADHAKIENQFEDNDQFEKTLLQFSSLGVNLKALSQELQIEGTKSFEKSWTALMNRIEEKRQHLSPDAYRDHGQEKRSL